ncbi:hypothetical protein [Nocardioides pacificus]
MFRPVLAGDLMRVAAALSVVVAAVQYGAVPAALFFLVLGGAMVPRALGAPWGLDLAYVTALLLAGWAAVLDLYRSVPGLDLAVHAVATGMIALMVHVLRLKMGAPADSWATTVSLALVLAVVWEVGEWWGHLTLDDRIQVGAADTLSDLVAGGLGAVAALWLSRAPVPVRQPASR